MEPGGRRLRLVVAAACVLFGASCSGGSKSASHHDKSANTGHSTPKATSKSASSTSRPSGHGGTTTTSRAGSNEPGTTTTTRPQTLLQALLAQSKDADVKVVYDTPNGTVTLIRRGGDTVYADGSGVRYTLGSTSFDCTGTGDGATCTRIHGDATQSDVDAYTGLVADALGDDPTVVPVTRAILGRTAECITITGHAAARAGREVNACIDDESGVLLHFQTFGPPAPGLLLNAIAIATPSDSDFQLPVPPDSAP